VVKNGCLRRLRCLPVVVDRDGVKQLRLHRWIEVGGALLDHAQPEVDVPQQPPLLGLAKDGAAPQFAHAADVVQQRRRKEQVDAQPWMELRRLAAEGRHSDRVFEQPSRVAVVAVDPGCREVPVALADRSILEQRPDDGRKGWVCDLRREELEEAVQLVGVPSQARSQARGIGALNGLHRPHLHLELPREALDAPEDADGVSLLEALVEELDVGPDARLDATAGVGELERQVRGAGSRPPPFLPRHGEHALDHSILGQVGDRRHGTSLRRTLVGTLAAMAEVRPFRAVRYSGAAGDLGELLAPPYDVLNDDERRMLARNPHNVVHLTLPESESSAASTYERWLADGVLVEEDEESAWFVAQDFVGPDGLERRREALIASLRATPLEEGEVLPHEATHARPIEGRLRLLRETGVELEPLFLLYDGDPPFERPTRPPDLEAGDIRLWHLPGNGLAEAFSGRQLLIADGHHRYEAALALGRETGRPEATRVLALLQSTSDPGFVIFPTHRVFMGRPELVPEGGVELADALGQLVSGATAPAVVVAYGRRGATLLHGEGDELDVHLVERFGHEGISYTPSSDVARAAVDSGAADVAFLLRPPQIEDVFAMARAGRRLPPKSTYFSPKLPSGLLFLPLDLDDA
jgi:uncharacterized protein (DUF1015 family)